MIETRESFCRFCHAACPIEVDVRVGTSEPRGTEVALAVRGVPSDPMFEGYTCVKGRQLADQHHSQDRIRQPLRRDSSGGLLPVSSSMALDIIADQVREIIETYGPRAIATYTGTGAFQNSTSLPVTQAFHDAIGSPSLYTSVTIDQPAHLTSRLRMGYWEAGWQNFRDSDVSMAIGYNPLVSSYAPAGGLQGTNPIVRLRRAKERGMKLIVVDPRRSELANHADVWLQVKPGEDPSLLAGMINVILREELHDAAFCQQWVESLHELKAAVSSFTPDMVARRCEVDIEDLLLAARLFATGPRGTAGTGTGPNMAPHSTLTEHLALTLNAICGRVNREGDVLESGNFLSPGDTRRAQVIAPSNPSPGALHRVKNLRGMPGEMLTPLLADEILEPGEGKVRCLFVCGGNPVVAFPDQKKTVEALNDLDLLVVIDHRFTATTELADFVIPPRLELERADVPAIMDRRFAEPYINYTPAILAADGDLLSEWEVFAGIAKRLGVVLSLAGGDLPLDGSASDDTVIDLIYAKSRLPMNDIRSGRATIREDLAVKVVAADPEADARFTVAPPDVVEELDVVFNEETSAEVLAGFDSDRYPFRLVVRRMKHVLNSLGREIPNLARIGTTNHAFMNPADLSDLGLEDGDLVRISSPTGVITGVVQASQTVKKTTISMSHAWGEVKDQNVRRNGSPTNRLCTVESGFDRINGMAVQSAIPVSVEKA